MGDCTNWAPHKVATVAKVGQRWRSVRSMLLSLFAYFVFLLGSSWPAAGPLLAGAADVSVEGGPERLTPTASGALAHTLKLLNPSSPAVRALRAIEEQRNQQEQDPIPVCSQSKYLCQIYTLHGALPDRHRVADAQNDWLSRAYGVAQQRSALGFRSSRRRRRLASIPFKIPAQLQQEMTNSHKRSGIPGGTSSRTPVLVERQSISIPSFTQVPQSSGRGGVFLPLRVQTFFSDFPHLLEGNVSHSLSVQRLHALAARDVAGRRIAASSGSSLEVQSIDNSVHSSDGNNAAKERHNTAERFKDVRRFFQVEVVPSAIWWLQRIVTVDRLLGPLLIKLSDEKNEKRLRNADEPGSTVLFHALTQVSMPATATPGIQRDGALHATETSPMKEMKQHPQHRFFLTTPGVVNAIHRHCGYSDVPGLEVALDKSGPSFFGPVYGREVQEAGYRRREELPTEWLLAAMEDTGWYLTDAIWSTGTPGTKLEVQGNSGCRSRADTVNLPSRAYSKKHMEEIHHSFGVSERGKLNGGVALTTAEALQRTFVNDSEYEYCICKPGTFGRNCEYADTERNRVRYPNRFSYAPNSSITVLKGKFFAIPAVVDGPHQLYFKPVSKLPAGVAIDSRTGAIFGTPVAPTKGCIPLAIEAQMREMPHAAERTLIRINVVEHLLVQGKANAKTDILPFNEGPQRASVASLHHEDNGQPHIHETGNAGFTDLDIGNPRDCERYVDGDMREQSEARNAV
ncbi:uncharacterized protein EMH_0058140 [Eimeria mitis]|uniref:Uncharacterized protein n=1 Tax=Eimeria mitis TaxID=44415 RepID=U6KGY1_9EIME|nr:uncharacterized protein EMH_0058140 [Eimeria mitis]CDJ36036.1 hypothetical protein, conserved [Eimeria mitis]